MRSNVSARMGSIGLSVPVVDQITAGGGGSDGFGWIVPKVRPRFAVLMHVAC